MKLLRKVISLAVSLIVLSEYANARKTYIIKEQIKEGTLAVHRPRVQASEIEYCWFDDGSSNNRYCYKGDQMLKVGWDNKYTYN